MTVPCAKQPLAQNKAVSSASAEETGAAAKPRAIRPIRWRTFMVSMIVGFAVGALVAPLAREQVAGAFIVLGGLLIAAATARRAAVAETQVEALQEKLLDERSYHAFVDSAIEGFFRTTRNGRYLRANPALAQSAICRGAIARGNRRWPR